MTGPDKPEGESASDHGEPRYVETCNGADRLGAVAIGRSIGPVDPDGMEIGVFATQEEARAAVVRHAYARREGGHI